MAAEVDPEHVVALALEPIGGLVDRPHAVYFERPPFRDLRLDSEETAERQRPQMPDNFDRGVGFAILDRRHIAQVIVLLAWIILQPRHHLERGRSVDQDRPLYPDH